jgi:hypothetical protein
MYLCIVSQTDSFPNSRFCQQMTELELEVDRTIMKPFYKLVAILSSGFTSWKMDPFPMIAPTFDKNSHAPIQAPPPSETPVHAPTSLPSLLYKRSRLAQSQPFLVPSFSRQSGGSCLSVNLALGCETFLMSFLCERRFS